MDESNERRMQPHRLLAAFFLGVSLTLLLTSPHRSLGPITVSPGWVALWLVVAFGSTPLGGMLLVRKPWRDMPVDARRGPAMMYLTSAAIAALALAVLDTSLDGPGPLIALPIFAGLGLAYLYQRLYTAADEKREDIFP